ncbi:MAG: protein translocase subunit SecD, partial [Actinobacteria bacterium]
VMDRAELIVRNRVDGFGVKEASIQRQGSDSLLVQIPGIKNPDQALALLGETGRLEFVDVASITDTEAVAAITRGETPKLKQGTYSPITVDGTALTGGVIKNAAISQNSQNGQIEVNVTMDTKGSKAWAAYTSANVGKNVAIVLDGTVKSAPRVENAITGGQTSITGRFTVEEAKALKTVLDTGALPVTLVASESRVVGPTLGQDSLRQGLFAVALGLALVCVYVIAFYRGLGVLTVAALGVFGSMYVGILAVMSMFGVFSLTLPGIAGVVLTIGLAVDSSILINERFREEVRMGRTIRSAAGSGSQHGISTSIDADLVTFVSAAALYFFAIGPVRGFALTLMLGIVCDILMMVVFKRPALMLLSEKVIPGAPFVWGVRKEAAATASG